MNLHKTIPKILMIASWLTMTSVAYAAKYTYDDLNRLIQVAYDSGQVVNYSYDAGGNLLAVKSKSGVIFDDSGTQEPVTTYSASNCISDKFGQPIIGVTVQMGEKTTVTDNNGCWKIEGLGEGEHPVTISKAGYTFNSKTCVLSDNQKECQPNFKPESVLEIKVGAEPHIAKQGENVAYTIIVTNNGDDTATGIVLSEVLPEGTSLVSLETLDGGSCDTGTITCTLADLTPGTTATAKVVVSNTQAKKLVNTASVTANEYPADIVITRTTVVPYLSVSVACTPNPIKPEGVLHCTTAVDLSQYAPTTATGINLEMRLPRGVELNAIESDYAMCDTSKIPLITCQLTDLSIAGALSHVTVNVEMTLKDLGLLLLTHEAKVTANEYLDSHTDRERTKVFIPADIEVDIVFVIDVTGSMQEEINGVVKALQQFIAKIDPSTAPRIALVTFKDVVTVKAFTITGDLELLLSAIEKLKASGGDSCPEASAEALLIAIPHTKEGGDILFATDASPYADANVEQITEFLRNKGIRFNAMITGDCTQPDDWNKLPSAE